MGAAVALGKIKNAQAVPALIESLKDKNRAVRSIASAALGEILKSCATIEALNEFETHLQEGFDKLANMRWKRDKIIYVEMELSKLRLAAAQKKNKLAPKRDIILDEIPKPPKKGEVYQQIRRTVWNG
jgi:hypothetical protein